MVHASGRGWEGSSLVGGLSRFWERSRVARGVLQHNKTKSRLADWAAAIQHRKEMAR